MNKIYIFKLGDKWVFKHYFEDEEVYRLLSQFYQRARFRFECSTIEDRDKAAEFLKYHGFDVSVVENPSECVVRMNKQNYDSMVKVLKNSIAHRDVGEERIFLMMDAVSVEKALKEGAERYASSVDFF
jgi:hypothetical protein